MKIRPLRDYGASVGVEVYDIDWKCVEELEELGRLVASQCIVFIDEKITTEELYNTMINWGDISYPVITKYVTEKKLTGSHWRELTLNLRYITNQLPDLKSVALVSYLKDDRGRPKGLFSNGELDWHADQCAIDDGQRIIGLQSVSDSLNSQTQFLCTHDAFEKLSSSMKSTVKELVCKHKWQEGVMAPGLNASQSLMVRYNTVPIDGLETNLYSETASGLTGMKIPSHSFDGFVGMTKAESDKLLNELLKQIYREEYIYTQNWHDGQLIFMDQEITLHKRPTNVTDGDKRTMARSITYVNKLFPLSSRAQRTNTFKIDGKVYNEDEFAALVDKDRRRIYEKELEIA
jgi:alpha-ketoglutarate-dependent taurine dioxygenase